jgi:hypothetical protein
MMGIGWFRSEAANEIMISIYCEKIGNLARDFLRRAKRPPKDLPSVNDTANSAQRFIL